MASGSKPPSHCLRHGCFRVRRVRLDELECLSAWQKNDWHRRTSGQHEVHEARSVMIDFLLQLLCQAKAMYMSSMLDWGQWLMLPCRNNSSCPQDFVRACWTCPQQWKASMLLISRAIQIEMQFLLEKLAICVDDNNTPRAHEAAGCMHIYSTYCICSFTQLGAKQLNKMANVSVHAYRGELLLRKMLLLSLHHAQDTNQADL